MARKKNHDEEIIKEENEEIEDVNEEAAADNQTAEEIEQLNNKLVRLQADFLNYKSRTEKEKISSYSNAVSDFVLDLLPVVDNLERALCADDSNASSFKEGVQMVYDQFMGILNKKGLKEIEALHQPFDHNVHYGVGFEENDKYDDGTIIDVLQKGYTVNDKCIRPSMVRICKR